MADPTLNPVTAHELALYAINENRAFGCTYKDRLAVARKHITVQVHDWADQAEKYARLYRNEYGDPKSNVYDLFSPATILAAAAELAEYYGRHIHEGDA